MLDLMGWLLRVGAAGLAIAAGAAVYAAAPDGGDDARRQSLAHITCEGEWTTRWLDAMTVNPEAAMRRRAEFQNRCPPAPRATWDAPTLHRAMLLLGGSGAALLGGLLIASAVRRERLAAETLAAVRRRRHD